jgi:hypothetical protein
MTHLDNLSVLCSPLQLVLFEAMIWFLYVGIKIQLLVDGQMVERNGIDWCDMSLKGRIFRGAPLSIADLKIIFLYLDS